MGKDDQYDLNEIMIRIPPAKVGTTVYQSLSHLMTHKPKDPKCSACNWGKMQRRHCMRLVHDETK